MSSQGLTWLEQKVPEFAQLPKRDKTEILDFSLLWSFFEGTTLKGHANLESIREYVHGLDDNGRLERINFSEYLAYVRDRYFRDSEYSEHFQYLYVEMSGDPKEIHQMLKNQTNSKRVLLIGCLAIIFRLRNNLFHGEKWKYQLQGQQSNFNHASLLLIKLMS